MCHAPPGVIDKVKGGEAPWMHHRLGYDSFHNLDSTKSATKDRFNDYDIKYWHLIWDTYKSTIPSMDDTAQLPDEHSCSTSSWKSFAWVGLVQALRRTCTQADIDADVHDSGFIGVMRGVADFATCALMSRGFLGAVEISSKLNPSEGLFCSSSSKPTDLLRAKIVCLQPVEDAV